MSRTYTEGAFKKALWIGIEETLNERQRDHIGLRFEQSPHVWIIRLTAAATGEPYGDATKTHEHDLGCGVNGCAIA